MKPEGILRSLLKAVRGKAAETSVTGSVTSKSNNTVIVVHRMNNLTSELSARAQSSALLCTRTHTNKQTNTHTQRPYWDRSPKHGLQVGSELSAGASEASSVLADSS